MVLEELIITQDRPYDVVKKIIGGRKIDFGRGVEPKLRGQVAWLIETLELDRETSTGEYAFGRREEKMLVDHIIEVSLRSHDAIPQRRC